MIDVQMIVDFQCAAIPRWQAAGMDAGGDGIIGIVGRQHAINFQQWQMEDIARDPQTNDVDLAVTKRAIDRLNQQRHDLIEHIDDWLVRELRRLRVEPDAETPLNTETPGSVIDRLSILALRIYHMEEESRRPDASESDRSRALERLIVLREQHVDLVRSLGELFADIHSGRKRLRVYRQFKMYGSPQEPSGQR